MPTSEPVGESSLFTRCVTPLNASNTIFDFYRRRILLQNDVELRRRGGGGVKILMHHQKKTKSYTFIFD